MRTAKTLWSDWADAQAHPSLRWAHMPFCWFVMRWYSIHTPIPFLACYHSLVQVIFIFFWSQLKYLALVFVSLIHGWRVMVQKSTFLAQIWKLKSCDCETRGKPSKPNVAMIYPCRFVKVYQLVHEIPCREVSQINQTPERHLLMVT